MVEENQKENKPFKFLSKFFPDRTRSDVEGFEVPWKYSRRKAIELYEAKKDATGKDEKPFPEQEAIQKLYELYLRIGATGELPESVERIVAFLSTLWDVIYFKNDFVPEDIPFDILIDEFSLAMVQGKVEREGNNMNAICVAFNKWIKSEEVKNRLYRIRNEKYPGSKPKEIEAPVSSQFDTLEEAEENRLIQGKKVQEFPDEVIVRQANEILKMLDEDNLKHIDKLGVRSYTNKILKEFRERKSIQEKIKVKND